MPKSEIEDGIKQALSYLAILDESVEAGSEGDSYTVDFVKKTIVAHKMYTLIGTCLVEPCVTLH